MAKKKKKKKSITARESSANKARASSKNKSSSSSKSPKVNYELRKGESVSDYNKRIERERAAANSYTAKDQKKTTEETEDTKDTKDTKKGGLSLDALLKAAEYKALSADQQEVVKAVYMAIGENNAESAQKLVGAFQAAEKLADPFFKQQIRIARDAVERGFVEIDREAEFEEQQIATRLKDLQEDIATRSADLTIEESNALKNIERDYKQTLDTTRQSLAASGRGSSSVRAETEQLIEETTGEMREGTKRRFANARLDDQNRLTRGQRDVQSEVQRLRELAKERKTKLFRSAEEELGTAGLPSLNFDVQALGGIGGNINQRKTEDVISAVKNLF